MYKIHFCGFRPHMSLPHHIYTCILCTVHVPFGPFQIHRKDMATQIRNSLTNPGRQIKVGKCQESQLDLLLSQHKLNHLNQKRKIWLIKVCIKHTLLDTDIIHWNTLIADLKWVHTYIHTHVHVRGTLNRVTCTLDSMHSCTHIHVCVYRCNWC